MLSGHGGSFNHRLETEVRLFSEANAEKGHRDFSGLALNDLMPSRYPTWPRREDSSYLRPIAPSDPFLNLRITLKEVKKSHGYNDPSPWTIEERAAVAEHSPAQQLLRHARQLDQRGLTSPLPDLPSLFSPIDEFPICQVHDAPIWFGSLISSCSKCTPGRCPDGCEN